MGSGATPPFPLCSLSSPYSLAMWLHLMCGERAAPGQSGRMKESGRPAMHGRGGDWRGRWRPVLIGGSTRKPVARLDGDTQAGLTRRPRRAWWRDRRRRTHGGGRQTNGGVHVEEAGRPVAACSWRRSGGKQQACRRGRKSRCRSAATGEEEQAAMWRFFRVADSVVARDENFWEVKNRWVPWQFLRFLRVRGGSPLEIALGVRTHLESPD
jgi:hypothetical protein